MLKLEILILPTSISAKAWLASTCSPLLTRYLISLPAEEDLRRDCHTLVLCYDLYKETVILWHTLLCPAMDQVMMSYHFVALCRIATLSRWLLIATIWVDSTHPNIAFLTKFLCTASFKYNRPTVVSYLTTVGSLSLSKMQVLPPITTLYLATSSFMCVVKELPPNDTSWPPSDSLCRSTYRDHNIWDNYKVRKWTQA